METVAEPKSRAKYLEIVEALRHEIRSGHYGVGARLPSEAELTRKFAVSRMTVVKAMQQLRQEGVLVRRAGSGSYAATPASEPGGKIFGLLIPDLGQTEIFEPICRGMMRSPSVKGHSLSWGHTVAAGQPPEVEAEQLCRQYVEQAVAGVFFAPLEFRSSRADVNGRLLASLAKANIPVVLLDRDIVTFPKRSTYDLIRLDNRRAGFILTEHLIRQGATRIAFFARFRSANSAETVEDRIVGYRQALYAHGLPMTRDLLLLGQAADSSFVEAGLKTSGADAILCANDITAANLMQTLLALGVRIPEDVRIAGVDDVKYASFLPIPLTTYHQPCDELGAAAMSAMLDRINTPQLPTRTILLNGHLVVRRSCGA